MRNKFPIFAICAFATTSMVQVSAMPDLNDLLEGQTEARDRTKTDLKHELAQQAKMRREAERQTVLTQWLGRLDLTEDDLLPEERCIEEIESNIKKLRDFFSAPGHEVITVTPEMKTLLDEIINLSKNAQTTLLYTGCINAEFIDDKIKFKLDEHTEKRFKDYGEIISELQSENSDLTFIIKLVTEIKNFEADHGHPLSAYQDECRRYFS